MKSFNAHSIERLFLVCPFWIDALVQVHQHDVMLLDWLVKDALHMTMGPKAFFDVASTTKLGNELYRLKPKNVFGVEEHIPDNC